MNRTALRWAAAVAVVALLGCTGADDTAGDRPGHDESDVVAVADTSVPGLTLNEGERWKVDDHTRAVFTQMSATYDAGVAGGRDDDAVRATGTTLRDEIDDLIRGCTMTGAAHDNLHHFLMAYIPAVDSMKETGAAAYADTVGMLLGTYPEFFE